MNASEFKNKTMKQGRGNETNLDHVVDDGGLRNLLGSELGLSVEILSVVVSEMIVSCEDGIC